MRCHQRGSNVGSVERKWRQEACARRFLSEGLIVVCQQGRRSFSWLILSILLTFPPCLSPQAFPAQPQCYKLFISPLTGHQNLRFA